ncbi:YrhC family protein [Cytobacillus sp. Hz8]|uniref:YrhC family protein n=1 Tax=Cytobacillus sp. Hz8 TaxID=3347168 RepID=UPI0035DA1FEB
MNKRAKKLYENMIDFKRFAVIFLALGSFFYLGVVLPSNKTEGEQYIMMATSAVLLLGSILLFYFSKRSRLKLQELEEEQE